MNKIVTFFGASAGVGTTMLSLDIALQLAERRKKVMYVFASSNPSTDFLDNSKFANRSLDELRPSLRAGNITKEEILNVCYKKDKLYILPPIKDMTLIRTFTENDLKNIFDLIKDDFDNIIVDAGSNIQYPLGISALLTNDQLFVVLTQQEKVINRYVLLKETILKPLQLKHSIIVNMYNRISPSYTIENIKAMTKADSIFPVQAVEQGWEAEILRETLIKYPKYKDGIKPMVNEIVAEYNVIGKSKTLAFLENWRASELERNQ